MNLVSKALAVLVAVGTVAFVSQCGDAAGVAGKSYSYETIPTPDVPDVHTGCGEFEPGALFLVTIDDPATVYDGSWRQRRFRRRTFFRSEFDVEYGGDTYYFNVAGRMPTSGLLVGTSTFAEIGGPTKFVRWKANEDAGCDLVAP